MASWLGLESRARGLQVWCGICGSTEHRSAECDCWAQWGAAAGDVGSVGSPGEVMSDDVVEELLTSDSESDASDLEEGEEYAPP